MGFSFVSSVRTLNVRNIQHKIIINKKEYGQK